MTAKAKIKELNVKKQSIIVSLSRTEKFIKEFDNAQVFQLSYRLEETKKLKNSFSDIINELVVLTNEYDKYNAELDEVDNKFFGVVGELESLLHACSKMAQSQAACLKDAVPDVHSDTAATFQSVRLPQISLPFFNADLHTWMSFKDNFKSLIHENNSLSPVQKLHYLRSCLKGQAFELISNLPITDANYFIAWDLLLSRFDNIRLISQTHVKTLFNLPRIKNDNISDLKFITNEYFKNVRALKSLGENIDTADFILIPLLTSKLDNATLKRWEQCVSSYPDDKNPLLPDLETFLLKEINIIEVSNQPSTSYTQGLKPVTNKLPNAYMSTPGKQNVNSDYRNTDSAFPKFRNKYPSYNYPSLQENSPVFKASPNTPNKSNQQYKCYVCPEFHKLYQCLSFKALSPQERLNLINKKNLCRNCFNFQHKASNCPNPGVCKKCFSKHHSLLHIDNPVPTSETVLMSSQGSTTKVLLATAQILVKDSFDNFIKATALLDSGAQSNFITNSLASRLGGSYKIVNAPICGINQSKSMIDHQIQVKIKSRISEYSTKVDMLILPKICENLPQIPIPVTKWNLPPNIVLADPEFHSPHDIDIILGSELFFEILSPEKFKLNDKLPIFQNTTFGWIIAGKYCNDDFAVNFLATDIHEVNTTPTIDSSLNDSLVKFWEIEQVPKMKVMSSREKFVDKFYDDTVSKDPSGRYQVHLPFSRDPSCLGNSSNLALNRFYSLEKRFSSDPIFFQQYKNFIDEYISMGHMEEIQESEYSSIHSAPNYFFPHHAVRKEDSLTSKIRVVFNGSAPTTSKISLNEILEIGPALQKSSFNIILRFRSHKFAITADIEKMYRQILVFYPHTNFQLIYWRDHPSEKVKIFRLLTVTYGTRSAPYLAIKTLKKLATDEAHKFPLASKCILNDFFVDDCVSGVDVPAMLLELHDQLNSLLESAGMSLRKWCSNNQHFISSLNQKTSDPLYSLDLSSNINVKTLGVYWDPASDLFRYQVHLPNQKVVTKRTIVSDVARIYDPLGLLCPVVTYAKILIQNLWLRNLNWDDKIPIDDLNLWNDFRSDLSCLHQIEINRYIGEHHVAVNELHGFCDASTKAYGAVLYLKSRTAEGCKVIILAAKSRVAPVQSLSLPKLELCGAHLLANLYLSVSYSLPNINISSVRFWSDSTIVLHWLAGEPTKWKTFVCNRVSEIQESTKNGIWSHVLSEDNPSDLITRGLVPSNFLKQLPFWLHGPSWLQNLSYVYKPFNESTCIDVPESKNISQNMPTFQNHQEPLIIEIEKYSSWRNLYRSFAYVNRFISNCKLLPSNRLHGPLSVNEIKQAQILIIKVCQQEMFPDEIKALKAEKQISKSSKILSFNPFLDNSSMLRVGGRLQNSLLPYDQKHQILLGYKHPLTRLIVTHYHFCTLHSGPQQLLYRVRLRFWPISGKNLCKDIFRKCITCFKCNPKPLSYLMGELPADRVNVNRPFYNTGVDFAGPILTKQSNRRNSPLVKSYVCIYVCMSTKAIHLETVSNLSSEAFLACLRRFVSRRGLVKTIYCDNGSNFVGANSTLREIYALVRSKQFQNHILTDISDQEIEFKFIPSRSPSLGGLWEAGVKQMKFHLRRVMGLNNYTFEELTTVLAQIESQLNSRPLTPMSSDPSDYSVLTPSHFLIGGPLTAIPDYPETKPGLLRRWQLIQFTQRQFWKKWSREYLGSLQQRCKWRTTGPNVKTGTLVLLKEDNIAPLHWVKGRIEELHPGKDNIIRVATVRTSNGNKTRRSLTKLCPLPIYQDHSPNKE